jgi:hypothetical protein
MDGGTARSASRVEMITTGSTRSDSTTAAVATVNPSPRTRAMMPSPRIPKTIEGTPARFWMFSSRNRLCHRVPSAYSSR